MTRPAATLIDNPTTNPQPSQTRKRTRGPNKPKVPDVAITMTREASIGQTAIVKLLKDFVAAKENAELAGEMELQVWNDGSQTWCPVHQRGNDADVRGVVRFATNGAK